MLDLLKSLLGSKKFVAAIVTAVAWLLGYLGLHVDPTALAGAIAPLIAYIIGQGIADHGKEAVKEAEKIAAAKDPPKA